MNKIKRWQAETEANIARAAALVGPHDPNEVSAFCARLSHAEGHDGDQVASTLRGMRLPSGFMHVRAFDARTGDLVAGSYTTTDEPVGAIGVLGCALAVVGNDPRNWIGTDPLLVTRTGVLDLAISYGVPPHIAAARS